MNKIELRKALKSQLVNATQKVQQEKKLLEMLWEFISANKPACIGLYAAIENEIDLSSIFEKCQEDRIASAYPRITEDIITFHKIDSLSLLSSKILGILEPGQLAPLVIPDLLVVPGLAFTKNGKRLGRGKGHYDRYLSQHTSHAVSLAFSWQLVDDLPTEPHDERIDKVIYC